MIKECKLKLKLRLYMFQDVCGNRFTCAWFRRPFVSEFLRYLCVGSSSICERVSSLPVRGFVENPFVSERITSSLLL